MTWDTGSERSGAQALQQEARWPPRRAGCATRAPGHRTVTHILVLKDFLTRTWRVIHQEEQSWKSTGWSLSREGAAGALHSQVCAPVQSTAGA